MISWLKNALQTAKKVEAQRKAINLSIKWAAMLDFRNAVACHRTPAWKEKVKLLNLTYAVEIFPTRMFNSSDFVKGVTLALITLLFSCFENNHARKYGAGNVWANGSKGTSEVFLWSVSGFRPLKGWPPPPPSLADLPIFVRKSEIYFFRNIQKTRPDGIHPYWAFLKAIMERDSHWYLSTWI